VLHHFTERAKAVGPAVLEDIYDGKVWKELQATKKPGSSKSCWFQKGSYDIALQLNCDGFQPFSKISYSCTAVFMAILNLPREIRYLQENMILVALIPGTKDFINIRVILGGFILLQLLCFWSYRAIRA